MVFARPLNRDSRKPVQPRRLLRQGTGVPRTTSRPLNGTARPLNKAMPRPRTTSPSATPMATRAKDHVEAVKWFRKAAEQDHTDAQVNLAVAYAKATA